MSANNSGQNDFKKGVVQVAFHNNSQNGQYSVCDMKMMDNGNVMLTLSKGTKGDKVNRQSIAISLAPFEVAWLAQVSHGMAVRSVVKKMDSNGEV